VEEMRSETRLENKAAPRNAASSPGSPCRSYICGGGVVLAGGFCSFCFFSFFFFLSFLF